MCRFLTAGNDDLTTRFGGRRSGNTDCSSDSSALAGWGCSEASSCRFLTAGNDDLTTRFGGRRSKSAKARNRGGG